MLDCEDEMSCLVSGCNFLLNAIPNEAFTYEDQATTFVPNGGYIPMLLIPMMLLRWVYSNAADTDDATTMGIFRCC